MQIIFHTNIKAKSKPSPVGEIKLKNKTYKTKSHPKGGATNGAILNYFSIWSNIFIKTLILINKKGLH